MQNTNPPQRTNLTTYRTPSNAITFEIDEGTPLPQLNLATLASARKARGTARSARTPSSSGLKIGAGSRGVEADELGSSPWGSHRRGDGDGENLEVEVDMARMQLISPPPEEVLRRRHAMPPPTTPTPFTASLLTRSSRPSASAAAAPLQGQDETSPGTSKRKRSAHVTPKPTRVLPSQSSSSRLEDAGGSVDGVGVAQWAQATPNPRSRKQVRRSPLDEEGEPEIQDVEMASPTKEKGKRPAAARNLTTSSVKGKGRKARESPAYEPPPDMYMIPIRHTTLSPPPESGRSARAKGKGKERMVARAKGRESIREEMEDEEDGDPLLLSSSGALEDGDEWGRPVEPPGWIVRTPKKDTPRRRAGLGKSTVKSTKRVVRTPGKTPGSTVKRKVTVELESTSVREAVDVVLLEEGVGDEDGDGEDGGELGRLLEKRRSVGGKFSMGREAKPTPVEKVDGDLNRKGGPLDFDLPPSSPPPEQSSEGNFDWTRQAGVDVGGFEGSEEDSMMQPDPGDAAVAPVHLPDLSSLNAAAAKRGVGEGEGDGWTSDEDSGDDLGGFGQVEGTGEYTGRWRLMRVKTKEDPPSEATMQRMEDWGRPVSPYPGVRRLSAGGSEVVELPGTPPRAESPPLLGGEEEREPLPVAPEEDDEPRQERERKQDGDRTPKRRSTLDVQRLWEDAHLSPPKEQSHPQDTLPASREPEPHLSPNLVHAETLDPNANQASQHPSSDPSQEDEEEEEAVRVSLEPEDDVPRGPLLATPKPSYPSPMGSLKGGNHETISTAPLRQGPPQHVEGISSPIRPPRQQEVRRPTFPETPKGAFAFDNSSSPTQGYEGDGSSSPAKERYEEEYLVQTKAGDDYTEEEDEMEEDYEEEEEGKEFVPEEEGADLEEEMDAEEDVSGGTEDEQGGASIRAVVFDTPPRELRGAFAFDSLSPTAETSPIRVQVQQEAGLDARSRPKTFSNQTPAVQGGSVSTQPSHTPRSLPMLDTTPSSSSPSRGAELDHQPRLSPARRPQAPPSPPRLHAQETRVQLLPETPASKPVQPRPSFEENQVGQATAADDDDDDDDELDEAIVEELATPKNARELPYYDHYTPVHKTPFEPREHMATASEPALVGGSDGDESESDLEPGMVKIISADPRAAARAAAILKQYDYECYTKLAMKQLKTNEKKRRYSSVDDLSRSSIRQSLLGSAVSKSSSRQTADNRRRRLRSSLGMGVIGDKVVIPGSPSVTLPQLLEQVEEEVRKETPLVKRSTLAERQVERDEDANMETSAGLDGRRLKNPLIDPVMVRPLFETPPTLRAWNPPRLEERQQAQWTKEEWKLLDSCLTDERLEDSASPSVVEMKPVDGVDVESVIKRFVCMLGGDEALERYGDGWSRGDLRQRVKALQQKQRTGKVAPPSAPLTPHPAPANSSTPFGGERRLPSMEVPNFTPLGRRAKPPRRSRLSTERSSGRGDVPQTWPVFTDSQKEIISVPQLAPRYSHLLDEARAINAESVTIPTLDSSSRGHASNAMEDSHSEFVLSQTPNSAMKTPQIPQAHPPPLKTPSTSLHKRLSGIFFSYMPSLSATTTPPHRAPREAQPGLPLPPPELLQKNRTIKTPAKVSHPRPIPPKELVDLQPAPRPKPSMIPRRNRIQQPKRLVSLNHVSSLLPPVSNTRVDNTVCPGKNRVRVKDLVQGFEELSSKVEVDNQRSRPNSALSTYSSKGMISTPGTLMGMSKPGWKP